MSSYMKEFGPLHGILQVQVAYGYIVVGQKVNWMLTKLSKTAISFTKLNLKTLSQIKQWRIIRKNSKKKKKHSIWKLKKMLIKILLPLICNEPSEMQ